MYLSVQAFVQLDLLLVTATRVFCPCVEMALLQCLNEFLADYERKPDEQETTIAVELGFSDMTGKSWRTNALVCQLLMHGRTSALAAMQRECV